MPAVDSVEDRAGDLVSVEGDDPQRGVRGGIVNEAEEGLFGIVDPPVMVAERLGVGLEHAPHRGPIRRDRPDLEPFGQRQLGDGLEVGPEHREEPSMTPISAGL